MLRHEYSARKADYNDINKGVYFFKISVFCQCHSLQVGGRKNGNSTKTGKEENNFMVTVW